MSKGGKTRKRDLESQVPDFPRVVRPRTISVAASLPRAEPWSGVAAWRHFFEIDHPRSRSAAASCGGGRLDGGGGGDGMVKGRAGAAVGVQPAETLGHIASCETSVVGTRCQDTPCAHQSRTAAMTIPREEESMGQVTSDIVSAAGSRYRDLRTQQPGAAATAAAAVVGSRTSATGDNGFVEHVRTSAASSPHGSNYNRQSRAGTVSWQELSAAGAQCRMKISQQWMQTATCAAARAQALSESNGATVVSIVEKAKAAAGPDGRPVLTKQQKAVLKAHDEKHWGEVNSVFKGIFEAEATRTPQEIVQCGLHGSLMTPSVATVEVASGNLNFGDLVCCVSWTAIIVLSRFRGQSTIVRCRICDLLLMPC